MIISKDDIRKAKEKLDLDNAFWMAEILELQEFDEKNLKSLCPFHSEDTPSFIYDRKRYSFHCFGVCARSYDVIDVLMMRRGFTYIEAVQALFDRAKIRYSFGEAGVKTKTQYRYPKPEYAETKDKVYAYMKSRSISKETVDYLNIQQDTNGNMLFQYFDTNDVLTTCKVRPSRRIKKSENIPKIWYLKDKNGNPFDHADILYNMNKINVDAPLLITSGESDCAAAIESGWTNSVSIPGGDGNTKWVSECWEWLEQFEEIIICPDNDKSGMKYCKEIIPRLGSWRCRVAAVPEEVEVDGSTKKVNDLNELLHYSGKDAVMNIIVNAEASPVPSVVEFSTIKAVDISEMDGVRTGFKNIDDEMNKLFYGSFNVVSGYPSSGKTSFLYGLICNVIDQGVNVWSFSRELPDWMSKNWIMHMLAGRRHHKQMRDASGSTYYTVPKDVQEKINSYYAGQLYIYSDDYPNDTESILTSMVDAARRYACKFFLIDNLMMVSLGGADEAKNDRQTQFVNSLIAFASKYQAVVVLVCHPNKQSDVMQNVGMYQISGTSNIINLAHRAFGLRRVTKKEHEGYSEGRKEYAPVHHDVTISIIKDRFGGKNQSEYKMFYDDVARRFYSDDDEYGRDYSWDKTQYIDHPKSEKLERIRQLESEAFGEVRGG